MYVMLILDLIIRKLSKFLYQKIIHTKAQEIINALSI